MQPRRAAASQRNTPSVIRTDLRFRVEVSLLLKELDLVSVRLGHVDRESQHSVMQVPEKADSRRLEPFGDRADAKDAKGHMVDLMRLSRFPQGQRDPLPERHDGPAIRQRDCGPWREAKQVEIKMS